jgi:ligand-binding sensor domain-containing protein
MKNQILKMAILFTLMTCCHWSCDKENQDGSEKTKWTIFDVSDGLISNPVYSIAVESENIIWIGTNRGISKLDGTTWTSYEDHGLANHIVSAIAIDKLGNKWFGTLGNGVVKFENNNNWITYDESNGLADNRVNAIIIDESNTIWFGTDKGVSKFDGLTWTTYTTSDGLVENHVFSIAIDNMGNFWFGTNGGVSKFNGATWTSYIYNGDKNKGIAGNGVMSIAVDNSGSKWFGTWGGLSEFNGTNWTNHLETEWLKAGSIANSIIVDSSGIVWFGSNGWGISKLNGKIWTTYTMANQSEIASVNAIATDSKGTMWFGTVEGILKLEFIK